MKFGNETYLSIMYITKIEEKVLSNFYYDIIYF